MHHINNTISLKEISGRVLSFAAVFMLVVLGGTYSHAAESFHSHHQVTESVSTSLPAVHAHLNGNDTTAKKNTDIHCGGEILFAPKPQDIGFVRPIGRPNNSSDRWLTGISKCLDPPPPRLFSKVI